MMEMLSELVPLNRVVCSPDYDRTIEYMKHVLPFEEISYTSADEHNGWVIPPRWDALEATIKRHGKLIYDGRWHPMAVMALSAPFRGRVSREELRRHLHYDHRYPDSIPFHFRQLFRIWQRDWGFCVPRTLHDALEPGDYDVLIETEESPGMLRMLELTLPGRRSETIVFGANLDHPGVANDGLAGVVVGIELFRWLMRTPRNFSYRLVLTQGIIGSEYYLGKQHPLRRSQLFEGVMLEMLGSPTPLGLQFSRSGRSNIELALKQVLSDRNISHRSGPFESIILNDEYIWEAYGVPMTSLSRFPYSEYHSDLDNIALMRPDSLDEAVDVLTEAIEVVESSELVIKQFDGNICLSNPEYDLYVDPGQVAFGDVPDETRKNMRLLMDTIPSLQKPVTVSQLARQVHLPVEAVRNYLTRWQEKGLLCLK